MWNILKFTDTKFIQVFGALKYFFCKVSIVFNTLICMWLCWSIKKLLIFWHSTFLRPEPMIRFVLEREEEMRNVICVLRQFLSVCHCDKCWVLCNWFVHLDMNTIFISFFGTSRCSACRTCYVRDPFIGAFAELRKPTISFVISVRLSVCIRSHETTGLPLDGFSWNLTFEYFFLNFVGKIQVSLKSNKNDRYFAWKPINFVRKIQVSLKSNKNDRYFAWKPINFVGKIQVSLKSNKNDKYFAWKPINQYTYLIITRSVLLRMKNVSDKICREDWIPHVMFNNFLFLKSFRLWDNVEK